MQHGAPERHVLAEASLRSETAEEGPKASHPQDDLGAVFPDISHQNSIGGVCGDQRGRELRGRSPHEASPQRPPSPLRASRTSLCTRSQREAWGPLQPALRLDSSPVSGITLVTKNFSLEFVAVYHFPPPPI